MATKISRETNLVESFLALKQDVETIGTAISLQEAGKKLRNGFLPYVVASQNLMQRSAPLRSTHKELDAALQQLSTRVKTTWGKIVPSEVYRAILSDDVETLENIAKISDLQTMKLANGELPPHFAIRHGKDRVVRWLLQTLHFDVSIKDHQGLTAIDHALLTNQPKMIALVLGASLGREIPETAVLHKAPLKKWTIIVHPSIPFLRFPVHLPSRPILLALMLLQEMQQLRFPPTPRLHPLHAAAFLGQIKEIETLLEKEPPNQRLAFLNRADAGGMTAMHFAALGGKEEVVKFLLKQGVKGDGKITNGMNALHLAALSDSAATIQELLNTGNFDPNVPDARGMVPLHFALLSPKLSAAKALVQKGADLFVQTTLETPFALFRAVIEERRNTRDPLKISPVALLSFCALTAGRIAYLFGDYTNGKFLGSIPVFARMIRNILTPSIPRRIGASIGLGGMTSHIVSDSPLYTLFASTWHTLSLGKTLPASIRSAWKNRHVEIYRPLRNILIHGANLGLAGWNNLYEPIALALDPSRRCRVIDPSTICGEKSDLDHCSRFINSLNPNDFCDAAFIVNTGRKRSDALRRFHPDHYHGDPRQEAYTKTTANINGAYDLSDACFHLAQTNSSAVCANVDNASLATCQKEWEYKMLFCENFQKILAPYAKMATDRINRESTQTLPQSPTQDGVPLLAGG